MQRNGTLGLDDDVVDMSVDEHPRVVYMIVYKKAGVCDAVKGTHLRVVQSTYTSPVENGIYLISMTTPLLFMISSV